MFNLDKYRQRRHVRRIIHAMRSAGWATWNEPDAEGFIFGYWWADPAYTFTAHVSDTVEFVKAEALDLASYCPEYRPRSTN